jgi:hypothetical protein
VPGARSPQGAAALVEVAEVAVARRRVNQARDACRTAAQRLASAAAAQDGADVFAVKAVECPGDADAVLALVRAALAERGRVDVVVLV